VRREGVLVRKRMVQWKKRKWRWKVRGKGNTGTDISIYVGNVRRYTCEETNGVRLMMTPTSPLSNSFFFPLWTCVSHRIITTAIHSLTFNFFVTLLSPSIYCFLCFLATTMCYVPGLAFPSFSFQVLLSFYHHSFLFTLYPLHIQPTLPNNNLHTHTHSAVLPNLLTSTITDIHFSKTFTVINKIKYVHQTHQYQILITQFDS